MDIIVKQNCLIKQNKQACSTNKVVAIIPAYNEENTIGTLIISTAQYVDEVIVVDDGSMDSTYKLAFDAGAYAYRHIGNLCYGEAIKTGFRIALLRGACAAVIIDGDGQHDPNDIPTVIQPILDGLADIVIASRFIRHRNCIPIIRRLGITFVNYLFNKLYQSSISDTQSGFRAFSLRAMQLSGFREKGMGISIEVLSKAIEQGMIIKEVPVPCTFHNNGTGNLSLLAQGITVVQAIIRCRYCHQITGSNSFPLSSGSDFET